MKGLIYLIKMILIYGDMSILGSTNKKKSRKPRRDSLSLHLEDRGFQNKAALCPYYTFKTQLTQPSEPSSNITREPSRPSRSR